MESGGVPAASDPSLDTAVVASSPLATIVLDGSRRLIGFNAAAERLTGRSAASVLDRPAAELFRAEDAERCLVLLESAVGNADDHVEMVLRTEDGRGVLAGISWAPLLQDGRPAGLVGVGRDVAHRKRLEHEATRMAESFRALAEGSDLGLYRFSFLPHLRVDYVNPYLETIIGVSCEELTADPAPLWERLDATTRAGLDHARRGGEVDWPLLGTWHHPDGHLVELEFREAPLYDVAGRLESVLGMVRDMTGQRRQEQALAAALDLERAATDRLRRVDELRKVFLQAVSHELRTPLTAVLGFSATLRDRVAELPAARAAAMADRVHRQAGRIQRLLDDLLDVDRLSRGVLTLTRTPVDLGALVQRVAAELGDDQLVIDAPSCTLAVDPLKIERIVVTLLVNARRHAGPAADVRLALRPGDDDVRLVVEDDGPGVPEDQWRTVFEPFAQGPTAEGAASPGTGIGLTLVAAFSELHGGRAWVERSELGGARFVVALPRP
jgi:PAS domain S-box-containing protein